MTNDCRHVKIETNYDGEQVERPYNNIFCPDCGKRIVEAFPTRPFKL